MHSYPKLHPESILLALLIGMVMFAALAIAARASAQNINSASAQHPGTAQIKVKRTAITYVTPSSGPQMYAAYCAACHGANADGSGPAVRSLSNKPTDLRTLSAHNGGKFPAGQVQCVLTLGEGSLLHGSGEMPIWHEAFLSLDNSATRMSVAKLRMYNLVSFLETLQVSNATTAH